MKKILLATDFSDNSIDAIDYALAMFDEENIEYYLLNVYSEPLPNVDVLISIIDLLSTVSKNKLSALIDKIHLIKSYELLNISSFSVYGDLSTAINKLLDQEDIYITVMGTTGTSESCSNLTGRSTADVVSNTHGPILAIPKNVKFNAPKKIAYASLNDEDSISKYNYLENLAMQHNSNLLSINIWNEIKSFSIKKLQEKLNKLISMQQIDILSMNAKEQYLFKHTYCNALKVELPFLEKTPFLAF